jgi:hypothetical protein
VRYRLGIAAGLLFGAALLAYGVAQRQAVSGGIGLGTFVLVALVGLGFRGKMRDGVPALAREGEWLVGGELREPLLVRETTFEIADASVGGWMIVLRNRHSTVRLSVGGWRLDGERFVTKAVAKRVLLAFGLKQQTR